MEKKGTPTMGGLIILLAILVPVLLLARLRNIYIIQKANQPQPDGAEQH